jgi:hypothetical protein
MNQNRCQELARTSLAETSGLAARTDRDLHVLFPQKLNESLQGIRERENPDPRKNKQIQERANRDQTCVWMRGRGRRKPCRPVCSSMAASHSLRLEATHIACLDFTSTRSHATTVNRAHLHSSRGISCSLQGLREREREWVANRAHLCGRT